VVGAPANHSFSLKSRTLFIEPRHAKQTGEGASLLHARARALPGLNSEYFFLLNSAFFLFPSLRLRIIKAGVVLRSVGIIKLHEAVGVGQDGAEVQPVEEISAGFDVEALAGKALRFQ
jgi:hypothetical protein